MVVEEEGASVSGLNPGLGPVKVWLLTGRPFLNHATVGEGLPETKKAQRLPIQLVGKTSKLGSRL